MTEHNMPGQAVRGWPRRVAAARWWRRWPGGAGVAKPKPPTLAFTPSSYDYTQVTTGQTASQTFTLTNTGRRASGTLRLRLAGAAAFSSPATPAAARTRRGRSGPGPRR